MVYLHGKNPYHMVRLYQNIRVEKKPKHKSIENMVMLVPITQYAIVKGIVLMQIILLMPRHVLLMMHVEHHFKITRN